jgi:LysM repeat protein
MENKEIEILYYPTEYSMTKTATYPDHKKNNLESTRTQYAGGDPETLSFDLFYDTYEYQEDVRKYTDQITDLLKIDPKLQAPPPLRFIWGMDSKEPFECTLESVTKKFTMFLKDGTPVRAVLSVKFKEYKQELNMREKTQQSPDKTKVHKTQIGDSLWMIACKAYGNAKFWRLIADENGIKNPRFIEPGKVLIIPPLE